MRVHDREIGPYGSAVQAYAAAGIPTFPLGGDDGKRPLVRRPMQFGIAAAVKLADRHAAANIGFWCGARSGLTIADIDTRDDRELDWTLKTFGDSPIIVQTGSGKYHVWYRHNGERRRIKPFEGHSIDLLGSNGLCVAPPSIRPGGGAYAFLRGNLADASSLPTIRAGALLALGDATPGYPSDQEKCAATGEQRDGVIGLGCRNDVLFRIGVQLARDCATDAELYRLLKAENDRRCVPPLLPAEVNRTSSSIWRLKVEGRLWARSSQMLVLDSEQISSFIQNGDSDGLMLLVKAKQAHAGQRGVFALSPKAMALGRVLGAWSSRRYRNAIKTNLAMGTIERTHGGGSRKGDAAQYRFSDPRPSRPRGCRSDPQYIKHPLCRFLSVHTGFKWTGFERAFKERACSGLVGSEFPRNTRVARLFQLSGKGSEPRAVVSVKSGKRATMTKPKYRGGRPTSYRPEFCQQIVALMSEGRSLEGCAVLIAVHPDTLNEWQHVHPEFSVAVRAGRGAATTFWENRLLDIAQGGPGNAQAIQWALRNRSRAASGWHHDSVKLEHSGPDGNPLPVEQRQKLDIAALTWEQRDQLEQLLLLTIVKKEGE